MGEHANFTPVTPIQNPASLLSRFSGIPYSHLSPIALTIVESRPGMIVISRNGVPGIIFAVRPKSKTPVHVMLKGHIPVADIPQNYKCSNISFEEARSKRAVANTWEEGETGYLEIKGKWEPVIIGPRCGSKKTVYIVDGSGRYTNLEMSFILNNVKDELRFK